MATLEAIQHLIEELGPAYDDVVNIAQFADGEWVIALADDSEIAIEADTDGDALVLSAELGVPADDRRSGVLETLLAANMLWREHGGIVMAAAGPEGEIFQIYPLSTSGLTVEGLYESLALFAEKARVWRSIVAGDGESDWEPEAPSALRV